MTFDPYLTSGLVGDVVISAAYFANQKKWLASDDWRFPGANLLGSALIMISFYDAWNLPAALIEVLWAGISIYGMTKARRAV